MVELALQRSQHRGNQPDLLQGTVAESRPLQRQRICAKAVEKMNLSRSDVLFQLHGESHSTFGIATANIFECCAMIAGGDT